MEPQSTIISDHGPEFTKAIDLLSQIKDRRFLDEAIEMARVAFVHYDPTKPKHHLVRRNGRQVNDNEMTYHDFFRMYAPDQFRFCRNVGAAIEVLDILIAQGIEVAA